MARSLYRLLRIGVRSVTLDADNHVQSYRVSLLDGSGCSASRSLKTHRRDPGHGDGTRGAEARSLRSPITRSHRW